VKLVGEALAIVQRAWANRLPDCDYLFHVNGKPLGPMLSELRRTCEALGIPYGRGNGIVFHDTRHSAVTNLVGAGVPEVVAMTVTGHADRSVFQRYNVRRDDVQADALAAQEQYLARKRGTTTIPTPTPINGRS
jgi:integrase